MGAQHGNCRRSCSSQTQTQATNDGSGVRHYDRQGQLAYNRIGLTSIQPGNQPISAGYRYRTGDKFCRVNKMTE